VDVAEESANKDAVIGVLRLTTSSTTKGKVMEEKLIILSE
jgi:hypothetical protein